MRKAAVLFIVIVFVFVAVSVGAEKSLETRCEVVADLSGEIMIRRQAGEPKYKTKKWIREVFENESVEASNYWTSVVDKAYHVDMEFFKDKKQRAIESFESHYFESCMNTLE